MLRALQIQITLFAVILSCTVSAGQPSSPKHFDFYDSTDRTLIFGDDFDKKDDSSWINACDCKNVSSIENAGYFYFINNNKKGSSSTPALKNVSLDTNIDFEIEFCARIPSENPDDYGTLYWGRPDYDDYYMHFSFNNSKAVIIASKPKADSDNYYFYNGKNIINKNKFNIYTIRKIGCRYFIFINKKFVGIFPFSLLNGSYMGLGGSSDNLVIYDYIHISALSKRKLFFLPPEYKNGENGISQYLKRLYYPKVAREQCMQGNFLVKLHVNAKGKLDNVISYSGFEPLNKVIIETLNPMPGDWYTAVRDGNNTDGWAILPMHLKTCPANKFNEAAYYYTKAIEAYKADKLDVALENFKIAAGMDYTDVNSLYNIAGIYLNEGKENEARYWLQRINELRDFDIPELEGIDAKITALGADELIKKYCSQ